MFSFQLITFAVIYVLFSLLYVVFSYLVRVPEENFDLTRLVYGICLPKQHLLLYKAPHISFAQKQNSLQSKTRMNELID